MMERLDDTREELMHRRNNGVEVFLYWYRTNNVLSVLLNDEQAQPPVHTEFFVPNDKGVEAFNHPYVWLPDGTDRA